MFTSFGIHSQSQCDYDCEEICASIDGTKGYDACMGSSTTYAWLIVLWESIIYPRDKFLEWHARECLLSECDNCQVENLPFCPMEEEGSFGHLVNWKHFSLEKIVTKNGEEKRKLTFVYKTTSSADFIQYLKPKLQHFVRHNFVAR
jgi:hypothetical protein